MNQFIAAIGFGVVTSSILALGAVGFTLQFGVTNVLNLAYADVMIATAFIAYLVAHAGGDLVVTFIVGTLFGAVASAVLNRALFSPFIRRGTGPFGMIVVAIGVSVMLENGLLAFIGPNFFSLPVQPGPFFPLGCDGLHEISARDSRRRGRCDGGGTRGAPPHTNRKGDEGHLGRCRARQGLWSRGRRIVDIGWLMSRGALRSCGRGARAECGHI